MTPDSLRKYNLIIMAGGTGGPLQESTGHPHKAMIEIHGKPMIEWVIDSFADNPRIKRIVVVGPSELDALACMSRVRKRLHASSNIVQNALEGMTYLRNRFYFGASRHPGYLISYCDAVFLNAAIVEETLAAFAERDAKVALTYVEKSTFEAAGLHAKRTYIPIPDKDGDKHFTGGTICYVASMRLLTPVLTKIHEMRKVRKDPMGLLNVLGCAGKGIADIESKIGELLDAPAHIHVSDHPEIGMDVDKPSDLELAQEWLAKG